MSLPRETPLPRRPEGKGVGKFSNPHPVWTGEILLRQTGGELAETPRLPRLQSVVYVDRKSTHKTGREKRLVPRANPRSGGVRVLAPARETNGFHPWEGGIEIPVDPRGRSPRAGGPLSNPGAELGKPSRDDSAPPPFGDAQHQARTGVARGRHQESQETGEDVPRVSPQAARFVQQRVRGVERSVRGPPGAGEKGERADPLLLKKAENPL